MPALKYRATPPWLLTPRRWLIGMIPVSTKRQALYLTTIGKRGDFVEPKTFNEKVNWRILNDRRDRIVKACDKMWMKEMARAAYPGLDLRIPATFWSGTDVGAAPDLMDLPPWVLKPNNSSGHAIFGPDPRVGREELRRQIRTWFDQTPLEMGEWGYGRARQQLLLEERIPTPDGEPPVDYKFFVFDGRIELIQVNRGRFGERQTATFFDTNWRRLPVHWLNQPVAEEPRPTELDRMLRIARILGTDWDFIRVDLYAVGGEVWFGEFSPYPGSGLRRYQPSSFDWEQGMHWKLPALSEVQPGRP
jgi:hypothetical protein